MPKKGSEAFNLMTPTEVSGYQEYMRRFREKAPQDTATRAGNTAYARAMKKVRAQKAHVSNALRGTDELPSL